MSPILSRLRIPRIVTILYKKFPHVARVLSVEVQKCYGVERSRVNVAAGSKDDNLPAVWASHHLGKRSM